MAMLATNYQKRQSLHRIFNNLLSRCDTIHDFTGERAKKVMYAHYNVDNIYQYLNRTPDLKDSNIMKEIQQAGINENRVLDDLKLILRRKDNPNFNFLQSYRNGVDERSCGYEPSVVQFFEFLLGQYDMLDPFYLLESDEVKKNCLIDYTASLGSLGSSGITMDAILGKICVMELGNTAKVTGSAEDDTTDMPDARQASGIWLSDDTMHNFRNDLTDFFAGTGVNRKKLRFVIDASIVSNDTFHDEGNPEGMKVALLACSEWDSAIKFSKGIVVPSEFYTQSTDLHDRVLYGLTSLYARTGSRSNNNDLVVLFDGKPVPGLDKIPREVGNIVDTLVQGAGGAAATGVAVPEAFRIIKHTVSHHDDSDRDTFDSVQGVLFDIKRSGDGCQVIQIKQMNSRVDAQEKYVLVTNDHLAFLKARLNMVPVIFTKRNTITGNKRLFLINDTEKGSLHDQAKNLIECLGKEKNGMQNFLETVKYPAIFSVFARVIIEFDKLKEEMLKRYFGEGKDDDGFFEQMVLDAISKKQIVRDSLTKQQLVDLHYVSMRMKAYLYDFLAVSLDLKTRKAMMERMFEHYHLLVKNANDCLQECQNTILEETTDDASLEKIIRLCRHNLGKFSLIKTRGYGRNLYEWALESEIESVLSVKFNRIRQVLSHENALALITTKHFLMQESTIEQHALNFRPLKIYNDIWRFLNTSYKSLSLSNIQPRVSRRSAKTTVAAIGNPASGSSIFLRKANEFIARIHQDFGVSHEIPAELRAILEEVCGMDEFYKTLIMENSAQNFSLRMVDAGYVRDWMTPQNTQTLSGGGDYPDVVLNENAMMLQDENENSTESARFYDMDDPVPMVNQTDGKPRKRSMNDSDITENMEAKRSERYQNYFADFEDVKKILYLDFLECFDGNPDNSSIFSSIGEYLMLQAAIEDSIEKLEGDLSIYDKSGAEESVQEILQNAGLLIGGGIGGAASNLVSNRFPLIYQIMDKCRQLVSVGNSDWRTAIRSSLSIGDRDNLPHHVSEHEWMRFLAKKLVVMPLDDLKLLHMRMTTT